MRWLIPLLAPVAAALILGFGLLIWLGDDTTKASSAPDYSSAAIGGVQYQVTASNEIGPSRPADARFIQGMPAGERRVPKGDHTPIIFSIVVIVAGVLAFLGWARAEREWPFAPAPQATASA
jgi:hypothetical protein